MGWLEGEVALITGAGSGLGRALVDRFIAEGARVVAVDRAPERVAEVEEAHGDDIVGVVADVTDGAANEHAVAAGVERFGKLDVFVGNAGIFDFGAGITNTPISALDKSFDEVFAINVKAHLLGVKAAVEALRDSSGCVLMTASMGSWNAGVGGVVYTASKHAVVGLVRQLAHELAPRVRVNGVAPGFMETDIRGPKSLGLQDATPASIPDLDLEGIAKATTPLGFLPRPEDYTGYFVLLASRANGGTTTGVVIECDGGLGVRGIGLATPP
jgi:NAD(P)-dependent dehydrogenase (short-subunit alcohol dehydrogenase family)